ncbi:MULTISPECIES: arsenic resistance N-acetyltransferase ArsN2 [Brevundimonas]|uniref:arsenic resistance N-acetyltransferase ArsN2 n=1 Tax=Brevundimonas TaxID=41275 RepID=UPI001908401C|nr:MULTISPECIES: arsenic resistance N-acetyltransferase ArsN2 [Brevundimonas]MBK1967846.1 GNAT family N-acetyltransferase [Brevundimonas diminuta]MBK1975420.1 GNAT family N-acetyltransferase [Brevundimonas diminuta]
MAFNAVELPEPTADLIAALEAAGLPTNDLHEPGRRFYRFEVDGRPIGYGGLEQIGLDGLIRSIVVIDSHRGAGHGSAILSLLETEAAGRKAAGLYLLTTTATAFFERHGYVVLPRSAAPTAIAASRQFSALCPTSATFMFKELRTQ